MVATQAKAMQLPSLSRDGWAGLQLTDLFVIHIVKDFLPAFRSVALDVGGHVPEVVVVAIGVLHARRASIELPWRPQLVRPTVRREQEPGRVVARRSR